MPEFKAEISDLCRQGDRSVGVAKDFGLAEHPQTCDSLLRNGVPVNRGGGSACRERWAGHYGGTRRTPCVVRSSDTPTPAVFAMIKNQPC